MTEEPKQYRTKLPAYRRKPGGGLSRFQSIEPHMNLGAATLSANHTAIINATTIFPKSIKSAAESPRVLVSGINNGKLGVTVRKGPWRGASIYHLTLVERETCPASCHIISQCYGNTMLIARRHRYGPDLIDALAVELAEKHRAHAAHGFVVRLHTLGDFPDVEYVRAWLRWMKRFPTLRVFGYTARAPDSDIGQMIQTGNAYFPHRWAIRFSVAPATPHASRQATTIWNRDELAAMPDAIVCPAQEVRPNNPDRHRTTACATCGLCWNPAAASRRIVFLGHGMRRQTGGRPVGSLDTKPRPKRKDAGQPNPRNRRQKTAVTTLSREDIAQIRRAIDGGITASVIAAQWCISIATIHRLAEIA